MSKLFCFPSGKGRYSIRKEFTGEFTPKGRKFFPNRVEPFTLCQKLWTKICEVRQNFKGDLTKFCEIFLNTLELPPYSLKSSFFLYKKFVTQQCVIYVNFFIKSVVKWSENSV